MELSYAILTDQSTQWFTFLATLDSNNNIVYHEEFQSAGILRTPFAANLLAREFCFYKVEIQGYGPCSGVAISEEEHRKLTIAMELYTCVTKFNNIMGVK